MKCGKTHTRYQVRKNAYAVPSAGKRIRGTKRGKTHTRYQVRKNAYAVSCAGKSIRGTKCGKTHTRYQARENAYAVPSAEQRISTPKHATGAAHDTRHSCHGLLCYDWLKTKSMFALINSCILIMS